MYCAYCKVYREKIPQPENNFKIVEVIDVCGHISDIRAKVLTILCSPCCWGLVAVGAIKPTFVSLILSEKVT